jgi:hypothetical protein
MVIFHPVFEKLFFTSSERRRSMTAQVNNAIVSAVRLRLPAAA